MTNQQPESFRATKTKFFRETKGVRFDRLVFGGLLAVLPALMAAKGCDIADIGSDDRACGGLQGLSCEAGEFCKYSENDSCGAADATGVCTDKPEACTLEYMPVCGCDGETYGNACSAHIEGVSVASEGECGEPSNVCGGITGEGCDDGEFCNYPSSAECGAADATGVCEPIAEVCPEIYAPVCGCDGKTYDNECFAAREGVSVESEGKCGEPSPDVCGGLLGTACGADEFCNYPLDALCGAADATGTCESLPEACDANYSPVCGCDDKTYGNECEANSAGVSVASEGECEDPSNGCGGLTGGSCDEDEFCNFPPDAICGAADATGVCTEKPEVCTLEDIPVCGCDGETYSNACLAHNAGVSVASEGECGVPSNVCGGITGEDCDDGQFCKYPSSAECGAADATGVCEKIAEVCPEIYAPVCGCDGKTYDNECFADREGVSVESEGKCGEPSPDVCGGLLGTACGADEFCNYPLDALCGAADATGTCESLPEACEDIYDPVCGCNDETYANECEAHAAGISVARAGECEAATKSCGGDLPDGGGTCAEGEFCNYSPDAYCGFADATGVCEPVPEACTTEYDPVCGCDGEIYGNACEAHAAGVAVNTTGDTCAE